MRFQSAAPVFLVSDIASTLRWYEEKLGFRGDPFPKVPPHAFAILSRDGVEIMLQALEGHGKSDLYGKRAGGVWNAYVRMQGVRELHERLSRDPAVTLLEPLTPQRHGDTDFVVRDPNGYVLVFGEGDGGSRSGGSTAEGP